MLNPDEKARLEIERDFLLESLRDLDAEAAAGDIEPDDYATLKDSYISSPSILLTGLFRKLSNITSTVTKLIFYSFIDMYWYYTLVLGY